MKQKVRVLISESFNPWLNIATEEWIFEDLVPDCQVLFLWRNKETVVIGRSQNPWSECNLKKMEEDRVFLARRATGGGAVFHDLGNTNFTFLSSNPNYDKAVNFKIIIQALKKFNITAAISGRNDLVVDVDDLGPRKISGSAFRESHDRAFHHGTLLIDASLKKISKYLTPDSKKLISKKISSVQSRIINLSELAKIDHAALSAQIIQEFFIHYKSECLVEILNEKKLELHPEIKVKYEKFSDWGWRFGKTPTFSHKFSEYLPSGFYQVYLNSQSGIFTDIQIFSDCLYPDVIDELVSSIKTQKISKSGIQKAFALAKVNYMNDKKCLELLVEVCDWLNQSL